MGFRFSRRELLAYLQALPGVAALLGCRPQPANTAAQINAPTTGVRDAATAARTGLVLCGPILRRVDGSSCTVFLALSAPCAVTLAVYEVGAQAPLLSAARQSLRMGKNMHIVVLTARGQGALQPGRVYEYDLRFEEPGRSRGLQDEGVLLPEGRPAGDLQRLTYPGHDRPSFAVPAAAATGGLRILHGSCRKPHGVGDDELARADQLLLASLTGQKGPRPQHLFLTGDQIYADDVHPALLAAAREVGGRFLGKDEEADPALGAVLSASSRQDALLAAGLSSTEAACHLITLAEFFGMYLLAWSDGLWPAGLKEVPELSGYARALPQVRRALANIPVSMIFDDHEITDDWYIRESWCDAVLSSSLGRRVLRNGLCAYAVFQHFGNCPEDFEPEGDRPGNRLLAQLVGWTGTTAQGRDSAIEQLLGMPAHGAALEQAGAEAVRWSYTLQGPDYQVVALDTRTRRSFRGPRVSLMSKAEIDARLGSGPASPLTIVLSAAPVINLRVVEGVQQVAAILGRAVQIDDEAWSHSLTYEHLLDRLFSLRRVVVLSGDVHYGLCASAYPDRDRSASVFNLVSSSLRNSSLKEGKGPPLDKVQVPPARQARSGTDVYVPSLVFHSQLAELRLGEGGRVTHTTWYRASSGEDQQRTQDLVLPPRS